MAALRGGREAARDRSPNYAAPERWHAARGVAAVRGGSPVVLLRVDTREGTLSVRRSFLRWFQRAIEHELVEDPREAGSDVVAAIFVWRVVEVVEDEDVLVIGGLYPEALQGARGSSI